MNVGNCVATPAVPAPGNAVQQWICEAVVGASKPLKVTLTAIVKILSSTITWAKPVPGEAFAGLSAEPDRTASKVNTDADACVARAHNATPTILPRKPVFIATLQYETNCNEIAYLRRRNVTR